MVYACVYVSEKEKVQVDDYAWHEPIVTPGIPPLPATQSDSGLAQV